MSMNKEVKKAIKTLKTFLGMETKLEDMPLADGMTTIQADMFEVGESVFIVVENAENLEANIPLGKLARHLYESHSKAGNGQLDFSSVFNLKKTD